jgi:hypothetical protein
MQSAGNHQVKHQPEVTFYSNRDSLSDSPQFSREASFHIRYWRLHGAKQKRAGQSNVLDPLPDDASFKGANVSGKIR